MAKFIFIGLIAFASSICAAQQIAWKETNGIPGASLIMEGRGGRMYAVNNLFTDTRYYVSTNEGEDWQLGPVQRGRIVGFATKGDTLLASHLENGYQQVWLSPDGGNNWTSILLEQGLAHTSFMISDSGTIFSLHELTLGQFSVSRYIGSTWLDVGTPRMFQNQFILASAVDHRNNLIIDAWVDGLWVSLDEGQTWSSTLGETADAMGVGPDNKIYAGVNPEFSGVVKDGAVMVSSDGGGTWANTGLTNQYFNTLSADAAGNIYAATRDGIFHYSPSSGGWLDASPAPGYYDAVFMSAAGTVLAGLSSFSAQNFGGTATVFRSTDGGGTWSANGPKFLDVFSLLTMPDGQIFAGTLGDRIFETTNGGQSWHQAAAGTMPDNIFSLASSGGVLYAGTDKGLYGSRDDGSSWTNVTGSAVTGSAYAVAIGSGGAIFIGTPFGVYASTDSGSSWRQSGLATSAVRFMACDPSGVVYAATDSDVFSSSDEGANWFSRGLARDDIQTIATDNAGSVYVGIYGGILVSGDGGASWSQHTFTNSYVYSVACNGSANMAAGTYNGVYLSREGGTSWSFAGLSGEPVLSLAYDANQILIAGAYHGGVFESSSPVTGVEEGARATVPASSQLMQNYPNPFNPRTDIRYRISDIRQVSLRVYDVLGREVAMLVNERKGAGEYAVEWNAGGLPSGVYFYRLTAGRFAETRKMVVMK